MIPQSIFDLMSQFTAGMLINVPPLPVEWTNAIASVSSGMAFFAGKIALLEPIVPFTVMSSLVNIWIGVLSFWGIIMVTKVVLWAFGK